MIPASLCSSMTMAFWMPTRAKSWATNGSRRLGLTTISGLIITSPMRVRVGESDFATTRYTIS